MALRPFALTLLLSLPCLVPAGDEGSGSERRPFRMPPQEAIAACAKLSLDAPCTFTFDGRNHEGTCRRGPEGQGPIACAPTRHGEEERGRGRERGPGREPDDRREPRRGP